MEDYGKLTGAALAATKRTMIADPDKLRCPLDAGALSWPDGVCTTCGRHYLLGALPALKDANLPGFLLHDFRPSVPEIEADRQDLHAHRKIVEGLLWFQERRLARWGFADLQAGLARWSRAGSGLLAYGLYWERTVRNAMEWIWSVVSRNVTKKVPAEDSIRSSLIAYAGAHEMISDFARPTWLGWHEARLKLAPALVHHHRNMLTLSRILARWGCREVLEFGCGTGVNLLLLTRACPNGETLQVSGFDYAISRVLAARATMEIFGLDVRNLFLADGLRLPFREGSFDVVFSHYVVEQMAGFEEQAVESMLRVARRGVVMFETALFRPTLNQRVYMAHSGYSRSLPEVVRRRRDVVVEEIRNITEDRFFGCPNVLIVLKRNSSAPPTV